jgi:hypothetical protein
VISEVVRLSHVAIGVSRKGTPSIQLAAVAAGSDAIAAECIVVATSRDDVRRLVRALQALAVDLPEHST